ncbi:MAG: sugar ABC transporter substrate-binding protein, partial [Lachnospiraceae bacterium]|nr:sugar ABC transporter substrate-binding protein [Lachnospiraceae bacterium]
MKRRAVALLSAAMMTISMAACGGNTNPAPTTTSSSSSGSSTAASSTGTETSAPAASADGGLIKVGIINNDPNESGYRTANDRDLQNMFKAENGYEAKFAYSLKNDEQIQAAQGFITDEVDYLLLSAADTAGWDGVLKDAQAA